MHSNTLQQGGRLSLFFCIPQPKSPFVLPPVLTALCSNRIQRGLGFHPGHLSPLHPDPFLYRHLLPQFLNKPRYAGALSALYRVATEEGLRGMYSGLIPSLVGVGHVVIQVCSGSVSHVQYSTSSYHLAQGISTVGFGVAEECGSWIGLLLEQRTLRCLLWASEAAGTAAECALVEVWCVPAAPAFVRLLGAHKQACPGVCVHI